MKRPLIALGCGIGAYVLFRGLYHLSALSIGIATSVSAVPGSESAYGLMRLAILAGVGLVAGLLAAWPAFLAPVRVKLRFAWFAVALLVWVALIVLSLGWLYVLGAVFINAGAILSAQLLQGRKPTGDKEQLPEPKE